MEKLQQLWNALTVRQRVQIAVAFGGTLLLVWIFTLYANRVRYDVLFANLEPEDSSRIVSYLKENRVNYRLSGNGRILEAPTEAIDELRLQLAGEGLTASGSDGFELFDKPSFGMSSFVQGINYQRALERELARTIQSLGAVATARVHLALPEESAFVDEQKQPSASVVVDLRPGRTVEREQVNAIINLVASGVENLSPSSVSLIDTQGRVLSGPNETEAAQQLASSDRQQSMERQIESRLVELLEPIVGVGGVKARASIELNMTRIDRVEEKFDPNVAVVRSEHKSKSKGAGGTTASGVPGTSSNLQGGSPTIAATGSESSDTQTNFELNKTISTISEPVGTLQRQSVAVVVDYVKVEETAEDGTVTMARNPRSPEEMQQIEDLVRAAIGFDPSRRDSLIVENAPFEIKELPPIADSPVTTLLPILLRYGMFPLMILLVMLLVIRPGLKALKALGAPAEDSNKGAAGGLPTVEQLEQQLLSGETAANTGFQFGPMNSPLQHHLLEAVREDPATAALVLKSWLQDEDEGSGK